MVLLYLAFEVIESEEASSVVYYMSAVIFLAALVGIIICGNYHRSYGLEPKKIATLCSISGVTERCVQMYPTTDWTFFTNVRRIWCRVSWNASSTTSQTRWQWNQSALWDHSSAKFRRSPGNSEGECCGQLPPWKRYARPDLSLPRPFKRGSPAGVEGAGHNHSIGGKHLSIWRSAFLSRLGGIPWNHCFRCVSGTNTPTAHRLWSKNWPDSASRGYSMVAMAGNFSRDFFHIFSSLWKALPNRMSRFPATSFVFHHTFSIHAT